jgi:hypothetical protein
MGTRHQFQGMPDPRNADRHRCGAKLHNKLATCRRWPVPGKKRCRLHGGMSTGARTREGKARAFAARREGLQRWFEEMRAKKVAGQIRRFPAGRQSGPGWITFRMGQRQALREFQEARAEDDRSSPAPPPRKRGRPSKADLILRAKPPAPSRQTSAVLQLLMQMIEEEKRKLEQAGLLIADE